MAGKGKSHQGSFLKPSGSTWPLPPWLFTLLTLCVSPSGALISHDTQCIEEKLFPQFLTGKTGLIHVCILPSSCLKTILPFELIFNLFPFMTLYLYMTYWLESRLFFLSFFLLLLSIPLIMPSCSGLPGIPYSNAIFNIIYKYLQIISAIDCYIKSEPSSLCSLKSVPFPLSVLSTHSLYFYHMNLAFFYPPFPPWLMGMGVKAVNQILSPGNLEGHRGCWKIWDGVWN